MLVGESTRADFVKNLEETMIQEVGEHYDEYTLYKEGHSKFKLASQFRSSLTLTQEQYMIYGFFLNNLISRLYQFI